MKEMESYNLCILLRLYFSLKSWKIGIFKLPLALITFFFNHVFHFQACVGDWEPIDDEIICFQVRLCPYLCNNFISVSVQETLFPSLKDAKTAKLVWR